jgi:hypothetical protein
MIRLMQCKWIAMMGESLSRHATEFKSLILIKARGDAN